MAWLRYPLYFFGIAIATWLLTRLEIWSPGSLRLHILNEGDVYGTSEYSPIELIQPLILAVCGLLMFSIARMYPPQRSLAQLFGGLAIVFFIRELDYFLDRFVIDNLWQVLIIVLGALLIVFAYRHRRRLRIALFRIWPCAKATSAGRKRSRPLEPGSGASSVAACAPCQKRRQIC